MQTRSRFPLNRLSAKRFIGIYQTAMGVLSQVPESSADVVYLPLIQPYLCEWSSYDPHYSLLLSDMGMPEEDFELALSDANALLQRAEQTILYASIVAGLTISGAFFSMLSALLELYENREVMQVLLGGGVRVLL